MNAHTHSNMPGVKWENIEDNKLHSNNHLYIENTQMQNNTAYCKRI